MVGGVCNGLGRLFEHRRHADPDRLRDRRADHQRRRHHRLHHRHVRHPEARTPEERAAAGGAPFNAKEVVDRAAKQYVEGTPAAAPRVATATPPVAASRRPWRRATAYGPPPCRARCCPCFRAGASRPVSDLGDDADLAGEPRRDTALAAAGGRAGLGRCPDSAGRLPDCRRADSRGAPLAVASARPAQPGVYAFWNAVVGLIGLTLRCGLPQEHAGDPRVPAAPAGHLPRPGACHSRHREMTERGARRLAAGRPAIQPRLTTGRSGSPGPLET